MIFSVTIRTQPWPDGEPLAALEVAGSRAAARTAAVELLRSIPEARLADVRLRVGLVDQYVRRQSRAGTSFIRHLYSAPMRARRAS
jgi:hypothetical protein